MTSPEKADFARIARRYDLLNSILSLGRDQAWRRSVAVRLPDGRILDLGSGTGAADPVLSGHEVVALDPVQEMLALSQMRWRVGAVGEQLPFRDGTFDGVFAAYVFRNLSSVDETLAEVRRVLRPGGVLGVVGLGRPINPALAALHRASTAIVLPTAGATVGASSDYRFLHQSLDKLPPAEELFAARGMDLEDVWRMGPLGFVYGAVLRKP